MENRVNVFPPETAMGYRERIRILRERKLEETDRDTEPDARQ